jgi:hypothetical protein
MTEALGESFSLDEIRNKSEPRAKFLTVQKLDKQLLFKLVRAMEMISDAVLI